jgi:hypothetical protein
MGIPAKKLINWAKKQKNNASKSKDPIDAEDADDMDDEDGDAEEIADAKKDAESDDDEDLEDEPPAYPHADDEEALDEHIPKVLKKDNPVPLLAKQANHPRAKKLAEAIKDKSQKLKGIVTKKEFQAHEDEAKAADAKDPKAYAAEVIRYKLGMK